jgi:hypothetical protein
MDIEFNSLKELYDRIKPALTSKRIEMKKYGFYHVKEADIWNYLTSKKWQTSKDLSLSEMVNDIFNSNPDDINNYVIKKMSLENREPYFDE